MTQRTKPRGVSDRFQVTYYGESLGPLWCVVDTDHPRRQADPNYSPVVKWHESVGWNTHFRDRDEAQTLADRCNAQPFDMEVS